MDERQETSMTDKDKIPLLKDEYLFLEKTFEDFDARLMTIKGWSATVAIAAIGLGFYQNSYLWLFAAGASAIFWILEATWKVYQYNYRPRIETLEEAFQENKFSEITPLQISRSWFESHRPLRERTLGFPMVRTLFIPIVLFPHFVIGLIGIILFVLEWKGVIHVPRPSK